MYKNIVTLVASGLVLISLSGCGQPDRPLLVPVDDLTNKTVHMKKVVPFGENSYIQASIRKECNIQNQLSSFVKQYSADESVTIVTNENADKSNEYFLDLKIISAISKGNAFLGHNKSTKVKGILYKNGENIASFIGFRHSSGGFGAGFKGSCSVLGRTVDALGLDISKWIKKPTKNDYIGQ